jgi:hypothetical protein
MTDKKNITRFSPKNLFLGEQKGVPLIRTGASSPRKDALVGEKLSGYFFRQ